MILIIYKAYIARPFESFTRRIDGGSASVMWDSIIVCVR